MGTTEGLEGPHAHGNGEVAIEGKGLKIKERLAQLNGSFPMDDAVLEGLRTPDFGDNSYQRWMLTAANSSARRSHVIIGAALQ